MSGPRENVRFSVVVPAYNEAGYIAQTLRSLQQQDFRGPYEVVVVDNNSTDTTVEIAESFGVRVVREPEPGVCHARQRGVAAARGEIVISVDADTIYPRDWLSRIDASFRSLPGVVGVAGPCEYRNPPWWISVFTTGLFGLVGAVYRMTGWLGYVTATNVAFRRDSFSGYDLNLTQGGDELDLLRRLRKRGRMVWDRHNVVFTSPRRQEAGFLQTIFVSFLLFYLGAYWLNRLTSRQLVGMAPIYRSERNPLRFRRVRWGVGVTLAVVLTTSVGVVRYLATR